MENNSSQAERVLREMEEEAKKSYFPIVGPEKGAIITDVILRLNPKRILEVGTLFGYSTILIGKNLGIGVEIITVEIDKEEAAKAKENLERAEILPDVKILLGDASGILPTLNGFFDFVFLDAVKTDNFEYLKAIENKLKKGSVIIADNAGIMRQQMKEYLDYVKSSGKYESLYFPCGSDGLEISYKL